MTTSAQRVLVVGVIPPLTWAVTRCFVRAGIRPVVLGSHRVSPLAWLADCSYVPMSSLRWAGSDLYPELASVERVCTKHAIDVVVPADYESALLLAGSGPLRCRARTCAIPEVHTLRKLNDKWQLACLLERLGLPYPRSELVSSPEALLHTQLAFPIVTKPTDRWAGVGFQIHRSASQLARTLAEHKLTASFPLLAQQYVRGVDVGFGFLAKHGRLVACTAFQRTFRGRRHFDAPRLRRCVEVLLEETRYHGVGEVDARRDPVTDRYTLLELNPRFWASLLHALNGGVNFPDLLVRLADLGDGPPRTARAGEARLRPYESVVRKAVQVSQRLHDVGYRMLRG